MVDHLDPAPLPQQLAAMLRQAVEAGEYRPGQPLPSETTLTQQHGVSRGTVREAMKILRDKASWLPSKGRHSYVARDK